MPGAEVAVAAATAGAALAAPADSATDSADSADSTQQLCTGAATHDGEQQEGGVAETASREEVMAAVQKQIEFYFSDANLPTDKHLLKHIQKDPEGYVPLRMIANFKRVKGLTKDLALVADALRDSQLLALDEEGERVRRTALLPAFDVADISRRTVVAEHLPDKPTIDTVTSLLSQYGQVVMVRICSPGSSGSGKLPAWLAKAVEAIHLTMAPGEYALVEFASEEDCVACVAKTRNPDNWRTSLRVRHLLPNFKPSKGSRPPSRAGTDHSSHDGSAHGKQHHQHGSREASSSGADGGRPGSRNSSRRASHDGGRRSSLDDQAHHQQHQPHGKQPPAAGATAVAAAAAAADGLPIQLAPIRTHAADRSASPAPAANGARLAGAAGTPPAISPSKAAQLGGVGGALGSPRKGQSPAPPGVSSFIDNILSAPTAGSPSRSGSGAARWSAGGSAADWAAGANSGGGSALTPAAAVAAALAGVSTPPQSGSPRHSTASGGGAGARSSQAGAAAGTPVRPSAGSLAAPGSSAVQGALAAQLAAAAAAAAQAAMSGSPRASQASSAAASWRSPTRPGSAAGGVSLSAPTTPLGGGGQGAGDAVADELEALLGGGGGSTFVVGSPDLCAGAGSPKPGPWISPTRRAHMLQQQQQQQQRRGRRGSEAEGGSDGGWRSSWSGCAGSSPGSGLKPPKPRTSGSGQGQAGPGRQRRRSWHATEGEDGAPADGSTSDGGGGSNGSRAAGSARRSRLGGGGAQGGEALKSPTCDAIREGSCELDASALAAAIAAGTAGAHGAGRRGSHPGDAGHAGDGGGEHEHDHEHAEDDGSGKRRRRHRRSGTGSRRQSLDEPAHGAEGQQGGGHGGALSPESSGCSRPQSGHSSHHGAASAAACDGDDHGSHRGGGHEPGAAKEKEPKKKEKKDYASWAAATPEFRAAAAAGNPARAGLSPLRASTGGGAPGTPHAHDGDSHARYARMPDGTRGFGAGRGRPVTPPPAV